MTQKLYGETFGGVIYQYQSGYSHSGFVSVLQVRDNADFSQQRAMAEPTLAMAAVCMSKLILRYLKLWPHLELVANLYPTNQELVDMYSSFKDTYVE